MEFYTYRLWEFNDIIECYAKVYGAPTHKKLISSQKVGIYPSWDMFVKAIKDKYE